MSGLLPLALERTTKKAFTAYCYAVALVVLYGCGSSSAGNGNGAQGNAGAGHGTGNSSGGASDAGGTSLNLGGTGGSFDPGVGGAPVAAGQAGAAQSFCEGSGPVIPLNGTDSCTGDLAKRTFRFAVCSCTNINFSGNVVTDAKNSATGVSSTTAASVGVDGTYNGNSASTKIGGSLWTDGDTAFSGHTISGELQCGGNLVVDGSSHVGANATITGGVQGGVTVDGGLRITPGMPHADVLAAGGVVEQAVTVPQACDCSKPLDIGSIVGFFKDHNDNDAIALDPDSLGHGDSEQTLTLPCGRYFISGVAGGAPLTVHATGRVVVAVAGSIIHNLTSVQFVVDKDAELDLFVAGDILLSGGASFGNKQRPAGTRMYVGGAFGYDGKLELAANLYLPTGSFTTTTSGTEMYGSLFAKNIGISGDLTVHYDPSILDVQGCTPPGTSCGSCHDCANPSPACKDGVCGACQNDSDCCPPLVCQSGACVPITPVVR